MRHIIILLFLLPLMAEAQTDASAHAKAAAKVRQRFHRDLPPGNYSGICPLGGGRYALVSDKAATDGFYVVKIEVDSLRGRISSVENEGYRSSGLPNRDMEGICYFPPAKTLFISGEKDNEVYEYSLDGQRTGRRLDMPAEFSKAGRNYGLESLTYDTVSRRFFTTTERPLPGDSMLRIQTFGDDLLPQRQYIYHTDAPISRKYYHGVSELCALPDGRLLVLERQLRVPRLKVGARSVVRIYETRPAGNTVLEKRLVAEVKGRATLTARSFANYEAMCQPCPGLLLLMADSQNRLRGVLRDWFLTIKSGS